VILVPVIFGLLGFAVDLGRLYLIRAELKTAANAMALAAAKELVGTEAALDNATALAQASLNSDSGYGNKYNFGGLSIGQTTGLLSSEIPTPSYYEKAADALGTGQEGDSGGTAGGATAKYAKVTVTADAPLLFWSFLSLGSERKTPVQAQAVAGISAPLCTACGIEPLAIAPIDSEDTTDFGYTVNTKYTFAFYCTGQPAPTQIAGPVIPYLILNRYNSEATVFPDQNTQLYRIGARGLPPSTSTAFSCVKVNSEDGEAIWESAAPVACNQNQPSVVPSLLCGIASRFESAVPDACTNISEVDSFQAYLPDTDLSDLDDYTAYTGNSRRLITVAVVDALSSGGGMVVQAFRQFLVEPNPDTTTVNPSDRNGRISVLYVGSVAPIKQGRFDGCQLAVGPGKVVLHQ
jgi:hypothetical protein